MKKLISILGVLSISASPVSFAIACGAKTNTSFDGKEDQDNISILMSQYAKALYLNQNEIDTTSEGLNKVHYSSSYIMNDHVKNNYISNLKIISFSGVETNAYTRYSEIASKYFKNSSEFVSSDVAVDDSVYKGEVVAPEISGTMSTLGSLLQSVPTILKSLANPAAFPGLMALVGQKLKDFVSVDLIKSLGKIVTDDVLKDFEKAFSIDAYKDDKGEFLSFEDAMNASIIALSNSIDKIINKDSSSEALSYKNSRDINSNIFGASKVLGQNIGGVLNGSKKINLDLLTDIGSLPGVLFFVRTLLVYLNSYSVTELTSKELTISEIDTKRTTKVAEKDNVFNFSNALKVLSIIVNDSSTSAKEGESSKGLGARVIRNLLGAFLATPSETKSENTSAKGNWTNLLKPYNGLKNGLINIVSQFAIALLGNESMDAVIYKIYIDSFLRTFINWGIGCESSNGLLTNDLKGTFEMIPNFISSFPDGMLKTLIKSIVENGDWNSNFATIGKWIEYLYDNKNEKLGLSIKKMLQGPIENIFKLPLFASKKEEVKVFDSKKDLGMGFLTTNSLQFIVNKMIENATPKKPEARDDDTSDVIVKFDSFAELFKRLYTNSTLSNALADLDNMMNILGLNSDGSIKEKSVLEQLQTVIQENVTWVGVVGNTLNGMINDFGEKIKVTKSEANKVFDSLKVTIDGQQTNDFTYTVKDATTNTENKFEIKLSYEGKYLKVSSISKL
ncbi:lipoprotein [Spiroplasma tabanidicola]|uniref:MOLPALP family lipoprotein n=1 Tax=Spiroplasma tabanidicola TaxID=324079 RepID=A0A6I6CD72_9MOLU|nr:lipoprotein [Spiroplasma tabanidicola]QGS52082.1 MOLPALP family lipoprotein [Spiroplasma tabanidicola]